MFAAERSPTGLIPAETAAYPVVASLLRGADRTERLHRGVFVAAGETGLGETDFPAECPYPFEAVMTRPVPRPPEED